MNPFDDMIPEEAESTQNELVTLLQRAYRKPVPVTPTEQEQIVARVRERLLRADPRLPVNEDLPVQPLGTADSFPLKAVTPHRRPGIMINTLAAVLVVGALIGASLLLFTHRPPSSTTTASPTGPIAGTPVTVYSERGGLEASMSLTPGPYFLSEVLVVDLSLTNHTQAPFSLQGTPTANPCESALSITMTGGGAPHYILPATGIMRCPPAWMQLKPGQTITIRQYISLTDSGHVTLTEEARFLTTKVNAGGQQVTTVGPSPLDGHWPSSSINVSSKVPQERKLSFRQEGSRVIVSAPAWAQSHLLYLYGVQCQDLQDAGSVESGNYAWEPLATNEVNEPGCPGKNVQWTFAFTAPGYAIVSGSYASK